MKNKFLIAALAALWCAGIGYNYFFNYISSTEVTVRVELSSAHGAPRTDITDLARIEAYETYFPEPGENIERYQRYGPIFPVDERADVFYVEAGVPAAFEATVGATTLGPQGTTGGGVEDYTVTLITHRSLVRLTVLTDGPPEVFVQAATELFPGSSNYEAQSQGVPEDGEMLFLLAEGEWTFSALDDRLDQTTVVTVPRGEMIEATLDLRTGG